MILLSCSGIAVPATGYYNVSIVDDDNKRRNCILIYPMKNIVATTLVASYFLI
jgi:hypothetical protein